MSAVWDWQPAESGRIEQSVALLRLDGSGTRRFLHGQTTAAIETAAAGAWISSCCTSPTARMRALIEVLLDDVGAWVAIHGVAPAQAESTRQAFDRVLFPADQVRLAPLQAAWLSTPVGPAPTPWPSSPPGQWRPLEEGNSWLLGNQVLRLADTPPPSWLAACPALAPNDQERWRLQQGIPAAPGELNDDTNPFELGLADRVSLNKGCYLGQETLAKLATYDGVKQQLRRWSAAMPLAVGTRLVAPDGSKAGVISSSLGLDDGTGIGLALVRRQALDQTTLLAEDPNPANGIPTAVSPMVEITLSLPERFSAPPGSSVKV
jgi:folate-binding protein YgfZ